MPRARSVIAAAAVVLAMAPAGRVRAQRPSDLASPAPRATPGPPDSIVGRYGPVQPEDLDQIAWNGRSYQQHNVLVHGALDVLVVGKYLALKEGTSRVMLIPIEPADYVDLSRLVGAEVDVTGIVRVLPSAQQLVRCPDPVPESKCEDPLLPVLPNAQPQWPPVSITIVHLSDRGTGRGARGGAAALADTGVAAAAAAGKPVRAIGQFRGANLCHDLPAESRHDPSDWILLTSEGPLWVTGRRPEGRGFRLDPAYRADTSRWLEVQGKVEIAGALRYLKASRIALAARPEESEAQPCPP